LLKDPELRDVWLKLGIDPAQVRPGSPLLFKTMRTVQDHVLYLEQRGVAEYVGSAVFTYGEPARELLYLPNIQVVNWKGKPCNSPTPTSPPPETSSASASDTADVVQTTATKVQKGVQKGGRKRHALADFL
jgi:hypothetical protein